MSRLGSVAIGDYFTLYGNANSSPSDRLQLIAWSGDYPVTRILASGYNGHLAYTIHTLSRATRVVRLY